MTNNDEGEGGDDVIYEQPLRPVEQRGGLRVRRSWPPSRKRWPGGRGSSTLRLGDLGLWFSSDPIVLKSVKQS